jgi:hypothetical protein
MLADATPARVRPIVPICGAIGLARIDRIMYCQVLARSGRLSRICHIGA